MSVHEDLLNNGENNCSFTEDEVDIMCSKDGDDACGDGMPYVKKSPINQRFLRFRKKNGCVFLFPQSDDITGNLPQGIGFLEQEIYILAKGYFFAKISLQRRLLWQKILKFMIC